MPIYEYKAKQQNAETVCGQIMAESQEQAVEKITQSGLLPVQVVETGVAKRSRTQRKPVRPKDLLLFSRELASLLKAGVPILSAMDVISRQVQHPYFQYVIQTVRSGIQGGRSVSESLADFPDVFPQLYVDMIRAGEESGRLPQVINSLAHHLKQHIAMSTKVRNAFVYPAVMFVFGIATVVFILTSVMPKIIGLFGTAQKLPAPTVFVMKLSHILVHYWPWITVGSILGVLIFQKWSKTANAQIWWSNLCLKIPMAGDFLLKVDLARFSRTFALLIQSGVSVVRAVKLSVPVVTNVFIRVQLIKCHEDLVAGRSFAQALKQMSLIPAMMTQMLSIGEESGALTESLTGLAESYEEDIDEGVRLMTTLIEPFMIVLVGGVIALIIIAMLLPIFQMDIMAG